ncbi:MAG: AAA family ATPase [Solirubrobacteraceae bacterium]|nr:AAA family ATPase [Solirubrobacteraceae bacterium]
MDCVEIRLLGRFEVTVDGAAVPDDAWPHRRAQDLVKVLALAPEHRRTRDEILEALWPTLAPQAGAANLHKAASNARRALGAKEAIVIRQGVVQLAPGARVATDLAEGAGDGELLPEDRYEEWTTAAREELSQRRLTTLRADERWNDILASDPADEEAHRALMRAHARDGDRVAAARQYRRARDELSALGLAPGAETEALYRELCQGPAVVAPTRGGAPVIGRDATLRTVAQAVTSARRGRGGALLVTADGGMGKTRLADAALAQAAAQGWHTLRGTARAGEGEVPYAPITEALDALLAERPELAVGLPDGARGVLALLTPYAPRAGTTPPGDAPRHRVVAAITQLLLAAAREHGLVLVVEDLHAADEATVEVVEHVARAARREALLVLATSRPTAEASPAARLRDTLVAQGAAIALELPPLGDGDIAEIARHAARRDLPATTEAAIVAAAAGNPFFAEELGAAADDDGQLRVGARAHQVLEDRLAHLPASAAAIVPLAATLDEPVTAPDLAALAGVTAEAAADAVEAGIAGEVLEPRPGGGARFRHPLLREAARRTLGPQRLAAAHAAAADRLREQDAAPELVAHHLLQAGDEAAAVPLLTEAARRAAALGAFADAQHDVERALDVAAPGLRGDLLLLLADLRHATGDQRAPATYQQALAAGVDAPPVAIELRRARAFLTVGDPASARAVLDALMVTEPADEQTVLVLRGMASWYLGDVDDARVQAEAARAHAAAAGYSDDGSLADLEAMIAHADGAWASQMEWQLSELWDAPEVAERVFDAYLCVSEYILHCGDPFEQIEAFASRVRERSARAGARRGEAFGATVVGEAALLAGDPAQARAHLVEAARLSRAVGARAGEALARARLGEALLHLGDRAAARAQLEHAIELGHDSPLAHHVLYLAHHPLLQVPEDPDEAYALLEQAETLLSDRPACRFCPVGYWAEAAGVAARAGEPERGREFLARAEQAAGLWRLSPWGAALAEGRGHVLRAEGDEPGAVAELQRAADEYEARGQILYARRAEALV